MSNKEAWRWATVLINIIISIIIGYLTKDYLLPILYVGVTTPLWFVYMEVYELNIRLRRWLQF